MEVKRAITSWKYNCYKRFLKLHFVEIAADNLLEALTTTKKEYSSMVDIRNNDIIVDNDINDLQDKQKFAAVIIYNNIFKYNYQERSERRLKKIPRSTGKIYWNDQD